MSYIIQVQNQYLRHYCVTNQSGNDVFEAEEGMIYKLQWDSLKEDGIFLLRGIDITDPTKYTKSTWFDAKTTKKLDFNAKYGLSRIGNTFYYVPKSTRHHEFHNLSTGEKIGVSNSLRENEYDYVQIQVGEGRQLLDLGLGKLVGPVFSQDDTVLKKYIENGEKIVIIGTKDDPKAVRLSS